MDNHPPKVFASGLSEIGISHDALVERCLTMPAGTGEEEYLAGLNNIMGDVI